MKRSGELMSFAFTGIPVLPVINGVKTAKEYNNNNRLEFWVPFVNHLPTANNNDKRNVTFSLLIRRLLVFYI